MAKPKFKKRYKFIVIEDSGFKHLGYPYYEILNKKTAEQIGTISWYPSWKKYIFSTKDLFVFDAKCLEDIVDFMKNEIQ